MFKRGASKAIIRPSCPPPTQATFRHAFLGAPAVGLLPPTASAFETMLSVAEKDDWIKESKNVTVNHMSTDFQWSAFSCFSHSKMDGLDC
jgi:hypothetical protein